MNVSCRFASLALLILMLAVPASAFAEPIVYESGNSLYTADTTGQNVRLLQGPQNIYGENWAFRSPQVSPDGVYYAVDHQCTQTFCSSY